MDDPCDDWTQSLANLRRSEPAQTPAPPCPALAPTKGQGPSPAPAPTRSERG